ncbi:hypothetical protein LPW11_16390 [Geomonas sp. RF6]|uniref:hypothetical protein n=1 Tax=Geomonas sp. RF6 TaxID=2897342 RepID=UPI001E52E4E1|nr:hypothetical protein [Geomonas sp. RF6]UFS69466.1 hypothetical protein LPW11_16390 [Geomonas sp. RF6]
MRRLVIGLIILVPVMAWGGNTSKTDEQQAAEEDICVAKAEYADAKNLFYTQTSGMVDMNSYQAQYLMDYKRKRLHYGQLLQRYSKKFGREFDGICTASGKVYHPTEAEKEAIRRAMTPPH